MDDLQTGILIGGFAVMFIMLAVFVLIDLHKRHFPTIIKKLSKENRIQDKYTCEIKELVKACELAGVRINAHYNYNNIYVKISYADKSFKECKIVNDEQAELLITELKKYLPK